MRGSICRAAVALAGGLLAAAAASTSEACSLHVWGDLSLQPSDTRALVKAKVNDHPVVFIVDTGAWVSSMPMPDAKRLGVKLDGWDYGSEGIGGGVGAIEGHMQLELGDVKLPGEAMTVMNTGSLDHDAVGLIGLDLLVQHDLEIDLAAHQIKLVKVEGCSAADLAYWAPDRAVNEVALENDGGKRPEILFNVMLNGHLVPAQLDSGSPHTIVTLSAARAAGADLSSAADAGHIGGIGVHTVAAETARFDTFSIGGETIRNARIIVSDMWKYNHVAETGTRLGAEAPEVFRPRMLLGADFLRAHRVLVANSMHLMAISYVGGPVFDISGAAESPAAPPPEQAPATPH